jgi:hypothetical protein
MKRNIIVEKLIKEGLSETTLVKLNDKQLNQLAERMLGETITTTMANIQKSPALQAAAKDKTQTLNVVGEELKGNQKKIDKNHNGKIDAQDFKILNGKKSKKCDHCGKEITNCSCDDSHLGEELKGKQKNIDKNHNGKIDADDFKILNKEKEKKGYVVPKPPIPNFNGHKKETPKETKEGNKFSGELAKAKSQHKDSFNVDGKKYDVKEGLFGDKHKKVDTIKHDGHEIDVFTKGNEKVYGHPRKEGTKGKNDSERLIYSDLEGLKKSTSLMNKGEKNVNFPKSKKISNPDYKSTVVDTNETKNWVNTLAESNLYHSFTSKNEIMELIQTKLNESETMTHKFGPKVNQGHNGIPEFMSYDAITSSGPTTAPTKPKPTIKPGTNPGTKPKTPYQPGPGPNPKPKALAEKKIK